MTVGDIARTGVVTVSADTTVQHMADLLREEQVGSLVVTDTDDPVTVDVDAGVYEALNTAREANVRRLPVLDGDELYGIVTLDDMIVLLAAEFREVSEIIQSESPPY